MTRQPGLSTYARATDFPPAVWEAVELSRRMDVPLACIPEVGHLLMVFAAHQPAGRICELGTACGVGAAWLAAGMTDGASLVTVELDAERAEGARRLLAALNVEVLTGDWRLALTRAPYDLVFNDGGPKHEPDAPDQILPLLRRGGLVIMDDFTPGRTSEEDATRHVWFGHGGYLARELNVSRSMSVIVAVRR